MRRFPATQRPVILTLMPGGYIEFREKGCRTRYIVSIESCFRMACWLFAEDQKRAHREARAARRNKR